jgi:hypothetical protein
MLLSDQAGSARARDQTLLGQGSYDFKVGKSIVTQSRDVNVAWPFSVSRFSRKDIRQPDHWRDLDGESIWLDNVARLREQHNPIARYVS